MNKPFQADLHCHSNFSDENLTPEELIDKALAIGLQGLSITDHDNADSYKTALPYAAKVGLPLITGAEFSAMHYETSIHILAYAFAPEHSLIKSFTKRHEERRQKRALEILSLLKKQQMPIHEKELETSPLQRHNFIGRPHIANIMVKKGYVSDIKEAFRKYLGEGKSCYVKGTIFSVEETIDVIHQAKGVAILAHPHLIKKKRTVNQLLEMEFDGLEAYYALMPKEQNAQWARKAEERAWLATGGSDFHGSVRPEISLGSSSTNEETFSYLHHLHQMNTSEWTAQNK